LSERCVGRVSRCSACTHFQACSVEDSVFLWLGDLWSATQLHGTKAWHAVCWLASAHWGCCLGRKCPLTWVVRMLNNLEPSTSHIPSQTESTFQSPGSILSIACRSFSFLLGLVWLHSCGWSVWRSRKRVPSGRVPRPVARSPANPQGKATCFLALVCRKGSQSTARAAV
jgi:hypothetical protein